MNSKHGDKGTTSFEVVMLLVFAGFFVVYFAPLFLKFLQVRASTDYFSQAIVLGQDIMERIRGKSFNPGGYLELRQRVNTEDKPYWTLAELKGFLYGSVPNEAIPLPVPPEAEELSRIVIRSPQSDMLVVEVEIRWKEPSKVPSPSLQTSPNLPTRSYRIATLMYEKGIRELRRGGL